MSLRLLTNNHNLMSKIRLSILTPGRACVSKTVTSVLVPSVDRQLGVLPGHCPIVTSFQSGTLSYRIGTELFRISLKNRFVKVQNDVVTVLSRSAQEIS